MELLINIFEIAILIYAIVYYKTSNKLCDAQRDLINEQQKKITHQQSLLEMKDENLRKHKRNYDELKKIADANGQQVDHLIGMIEQIQNLQSQGFTVVPVSNLIDEIKQLSYDGFIDYLESLSIPELSTVRHLLEQHKLSTQLDAMDGYLRNRTKNG